MAIIWFVGILSVVCVCLCFFCVRIINRRRKEPLPIKTFQGWRTCPNCRGMYAEMSSDVDGFCCESCQKEYRDVQILEHIAKL